LLLHRLQVELTVLNVIIPVAKQHSTWMWIPSSKFMITQKYCDISRLQVINDETGLPSCLNSHLGDLSRFVDVCCRWSSTRVLNHLRFQERVSMYRKHHWVSGTNMPDSTALAVGLCTWNFATGRQAIHNPKCGSCLHMSTRHVVVIQNTFA
jgi:hypothetical protein